MLLNNLILISSSLFSLSVSKPLNLRVAPRQQASTTSLPPADSHACGDIIVAYHNDYSYFTAELVWECLQSVPFNSAVALRFIDYYNTTLQFQSTLENLKSPPAEYQRPPVDVVHDLESIGRNVTAGVYRNQYEFEAELHLLVSRMFDTHVWLNAGILSAFSFVNAHGLISASENGITPPEVYIDFDLLNAEGRNPSPIATINGEDVASYLTHFAEMNAAGYVEGHADWNSLMDSPALEVQGVLSSFQYATLYPGDTIEYTFKNGSNYTQTWYAYYSETYGTGPLTTGGDFYNFFVLGLWPANYDDEHPEVWWPVWNTTSEGNSTESDSNTTPKPLDPYGCATGASTKDNWCSVTSGAYPNNPVVSQKDLAINGGGIVTGYILEDLSTGVLSIPSFVQDTNDIEYFRKAVREFINNATTAKVSKVVIDLQQNSGGSTFLAYDTFAQFFPTIEPYGASRMRSHALADVLGETYTSWWNKPGTNQDDWWNFAALEWIVTNRINADNDNPFASWSEFSGPVMSNGGQFTLPERYNTSDFTFDYAAFNYIPWGRDPDEPTEKTTQPWAAEDIVILTDGLCASTCNLFIEFMSHQAGVRTIVVGGQPTKGPMQAASGSRGATSYSAYEIDNDIERITQPSTDPDAVDPTLYNETARAQLPNRTDSGVWVKYASINLRNEVREGDATPLQFRYLAADCRIYYTVKNVYNMTQLWHDAVTATWSNPSLCVEDSTGYPSTRNVTAPRQAPTPPQQGQPLYYHFTDDLPFATPNSTFELQDTRTPAWTNAGALEPCKDNTGCFGNKICVPMTVYCASDRQHQKPIAVKACTLPCTFSDRVGGCVGSSDVFCLGSPDGKVPVSSKVLGQSTGDTLNAIWSGYCKTETGTSSLGNCPRV